MARMWHERRTLTYDADGDVVLQGLSPAPLLESGRRESNPRSQLGKLMFCL